MAGIYIHIPYCKQACHYCNFHFSTSLKNADQLVDAICHEVELQKNFITEEVDSIYFGGGTPSLLNVDRIDQILERIRDHFIINHNSEITLEANPDDITKDKLAGWENLGVNRLSLGVQTFDNEQLKKLNRSHNSDEAGQSIEQILSSNIENFTIDLIYGLPDQGLKIWKNNLKKVIEYNIPHISSYALTIEEKTVLAHWKEKGKLDLITDEDYEKEYNIMCELLYKAGYEHYEVSNFAKPGYKSRHNSSYWTGNKYLGFGPAAHSFNGTSRFFNVSNNAGYLRSINNGAIPNQEEVLTEDDRFHEHLLTGLRTNRGISLREVNDIFGKEIESEFIDFIKQCQKDNLAVLNGDRFILTEKGLFLSDSIIIELMN